MVPFTSRLAEYNLSDVPKQLRLARVYRWRAVHSLLVLPRLEVNSAIKPVACLLGNGGSEFVALA